MPKNILSWPRGSIPDWEDREEWHVDAIASDGFIAHPSDVQLDGLPDRVVELIPTNMGFYKRLIESAKEI